MRSSDLRRLNTSFELIVTVDGTLESNGVAFRRLTSYMPDEIKMSSRFQEIHSSLVGNKFTVDFSKLEEITTIDRYADYHRNESVL